MKKIFLLVVALSALSFLSLCPSGEAAEYSLRESHMENTCDSCHVGQPQPTQAGQISCKGCHMSPDKVVLKTQALGKRNPHTSPHWGTTTPCWMCHKEHSADVNYCLTCHTWDANSK